MAVVFINLQEGTRCHTAQSELYLILAWAELHVTALTTLYIPCIENWRTDFPNHQHLNFGECSYHPEVF